MTPAPAAGRGCPAWLAVARDAARAAARAAVIGVVLVSAPALAQVREGDPRERSEYLRWIETYPSFDDAVTISRARAWQALSSASFRAALVPAPGGRGVFAPLGPFGMVQTNGFFFSAPQSEGGRVAAIALDPSRRNTFYVGTANGGVWKTTDGGFTWRPMSDDQCGMTIGAIVVDPVNTNIVYASTGEPVESTAHACGVLRSTDGGESWTRLGGSVFSLTRIWALHLDPRTAGSTTGAVLVAAATTGLYRSADGGATWTQLMGSRFSDVVGHPTDGAVMYAARHGLSNSPGALFRSADAGLTWTEITGALPAGTAGRIELATSPARPGAVYAVAGDRTNNTLLGLYRWESGTGTVELAAAGLRFSSSRIDFGSQTQYDLAIAVDVADANRIYVAGVRAFRSEDGGATFIEMAGNVHVDWHVIRTDHADPSRLLVGNDGGVFMSYDRGISWHSRNYGMSTLLFYPGLAVHPTVSAFVLGGLQDNGAIRSGAFTVFEGVSGGDGGYAAINHLDPTIFWSTCQRAALQGCLYRHTPAGRSVRRAGISTTDRHPFIAPLVMSPSDPTRLYYATQRLWMTTNEGLQWTAQSADLTKGSGTLSAIAEAPNAATTVYVATNDGNVWVSTDGTASWRGPSTGLPNRAFTDISIDASNASRAFLAVGGFGSSHVFVTNDAGFSWTDVGAGLPDVPAHAVLAVPGTPRVYVGTDLGVYESMTGAPPWSRVPGLPAVRTTDLVFQSRFNLVIAGTYGRGLWGLDIGAAQTALRGDIDRNGVVNAADALLIQQLVSGSPLPDNLSAFPHGDANCDNRIDGLDALVVLRFAVGISTGTCVGTTT